MNISTELIEKAKTAKSAEELLLKAKAEGIELSAEQAAKYFADVNKTGELADDELNNVAGGCNDYKSGSSPKYSVGQKGKWIVAGPYDEGDVVKHVIVEVLSKVDGVYQYKVRYENGKTDILPEDCIVLL